MKIFLHIGVEKTGTSTIQEVLYQNRQALNNHGYFYLHQTGRTEYRDFPAYCMKLDKEDNYLRTHFIDSVEKRLEFNNDFIQKFSKVMTTLPANTHTVIISSEHFSSRLKHPEEVERVKKLLSEYSDDIKIVCYIREQSKKIVSQYSTRIKSGYIVGFEEFYQINLHKYVHDYSSILMLWGGVFGLLNIEVRIFDKAEFFNGDLIDDFLEIIDGELVKYLNISLGNRNESLNKNGVFLARMVNKMIPMFNPKKGINKTNRRLIAWIGRYIPGKLLKLSPEQRQEIRDSYRESNEKVLARHFPDRDRLF